MSKKWLVISFVIAMLIGISLYASVLQAHSGERAAYAPQLIKVQLSPQAMTRSSLPTGLYAEASSFGINELDQLLSVKGGTAIIRAHRKVKDQAWADKTGWDNWFLIRLDGRSSVEEAIASFKQNRYILEATPEYLAYTTAVPNDTHYTKQWGHNNTGQLPKYTSSGHTGAGVGTPGFDARLQLAWDDSQGYGSANIIIAIIDSGVDTAHEDLRLMAGWDYGDNDSNPMDDAPDAGHGTSCAGVAAAKANNGIGIAGVAGGSTVMPLKIADSAGDMYFSYINNAITHAADNGAHVISMSLGADADQGDIPSTDAAITYAYNAGVILFAATANADVATVEYPANHQHVISVGAASPTGQRKSATSSDGEYWWGSNYGVNTQDARNAVDIMAPTILPATDITGSAGYETGNYGLYFNGTSCATPFAAGVAALVLSKDPSLTPAELRAVLTSTATDMTFDGGAGWDRYTGYGLVNAYAALQSLNTGLPSVSITAPSNGSVHDLGATIAINATATDSDGSIANVAFYVDETLRFTDYSAPYSWSWNTTAVSAGVHTIKAVATDNEANTAEHSISISLVAPADEGFESGNFSAYAWVNSSPVPWTVQSSEKYSGTYAAKSGAIGNNAQTDLSITLVLSEAGNISFYQKVSSETNYDKLSFLIDGVQKGEWSGAGSWSNQSYPVSSGSHTFTWRYKKDSSTVSGSDCAWIDHIVFPPLGVYYAPAQNFSVQASHASVNLNWDVPASGTVQNYKIYRNSSYLATTANTSYQDLAVSNGNTYNYYVLAVYTGGQSEATETLSATPNALAPGNLQATAGDQRIVLNWDNVQLTSSGDGSVRAFSEYRIYRDGTALSTTAGNSYEDTGLSNGQQYSYYVTTLYTNPTGESAASNTATATPNMVTEVIIGTGTSSSGTSIAGPVNVYYQSLHGQSVYTAAELNALGVVGPINISQIGFNVTGLPGKAMPNYIIRMGHTSATNVSSWISTGLTTVWTSTSYQPTTTGWNMLTLSTPFLWNGTDNIVIDTAFGVIGSWDSSGTTQYSTVSNGYRYTRSDSADQSSVFSGSGYQNTTSSYRPNVKLTLIPSASGPTIVANPSTFSYGDIAIGTSSVQQFTIQNGGNQTLTGSITTPTGYTAALGRARSEELALASTQDSRNTLSFSINAGASQTYDLSFAPTAATAYNGNVVISSNAVNDATLNLSVTGAGFIPPTISIDNTALSAYLQVGEEGTDSFTISNTGSQTLTYEISLAELRRSSTTATLGTAKSDRSILGSTLSLDAVEYTAGSTQNLSFTVYNGSTDTEWLKEVIITFPAGVTVNSVSNFVGGSGGDLVPDNTSGNGITIDWFGEASSWGVIQGGQTATATVNVSIAPAFSGTMFLPFQIIGDTYNDEPHTIAGTLSVPEAIPPIAWLNVQPLSGSIPVGQSRLVTADFSAIGLPLGSYEALLTIHSNDPVNPQMAVNAVLDVWEFVNQAPVINLPASFSFLEDGSLTVDFSEYVDDVDEDALTLSYSGNTDVIVLINDLSVTFSAPPDWYGTETITFTVSDGELSASDQVNVIVTPVNDPPTIALPESFSFAEDGSLTVDFSQYVDDVDEDELTLSYSGNTNVLVSINDLSVTFTATPDWHGTESLSFTVSDGLLTATDNVDLIVTSVIDPAVILVAPLSLDYGEIEVGSTGVKTFTITNSGEATLTGDITSPAGYSVAEEGRSHSEFTIASETGKAGRNSLSYSIATGVTKSYNLSFAPTAAISYNGNVVISSNDPENPSTNIAITGMGYIPWLEAPTISISYMDATNYVKVQWDEIPNASYYQVWASADPYGTFSFLGETSDAFWDDTEHRSAKRFYKVIASNEPYLITK